MAAALTAHTASSTNPGENAPVICFTVPMIVGSRNPPIPPTAPTRPVTMPISREKRCGTIWNTTPLPSPSPIIVTRMADAATLSVAALATAR